MTTLAFAQDGEPTETVFAGGSASGGPAHPRATRPLRTVDAVARAAPRVAEPTGTELERELGKRLLAAAAWRARYVDWCLRPESPATAPTRGVLPVMSGVISAPDLERHGESGLAQAPPAPPYRPTATYGRVRAEPSLRANGAPVAVRPVIDPANISRQRAGLARAAVWVRNLGLIAVLLVIYQWWGTGLEQHRTQAQLAAAFRQAVAGRAAVAAPARTASPSSAPVPAPLPALPGGVVARLEIPAIQVDQYVVEGTSESDLQRGVGHYTGTPLPGQHGNSALAGHRTTYGAPFNRLGDLKPGDTIVATTVAGRFLYVVASSIKVAPYQTSVLLDYGDDRLTLQTCWPEFSASQRLIVVAHLTGPAPPVLVAHSAPPAALSTTPKATTLSAAIASHLHSSGSRGFNLLALPGVLLITGLLVGLALLYRPVRGWLPPLSTAAVLAPCWLAGLLILCQQLNRFLPPNV